MLKLILEFHHLGQRALDAGAEFSEIINLTVRERIGRAKYTSEDEIEVLDEIIKELREQMSSLISEGGFEYA